MPFARHQHVILDPHTAPPGDVDARLDRDHHSRLERAFFVLSQARGLVNLEADAVSQPVAEFGAITGVFDHLTSGPIDVFHHRVGPDGVDRRLLGAQHNSINSFKFGRDSTCR
jgi:hypothetical protein